MLIMRFYYHPAFRQIALLERRPGEQGRTADGAEIRPKPPM